MDAYRPAVLLDLDGTLVDSVYAHVVAWDRALAEAGHEVPLWRIHGAIGMGSDRLLPWLLGRHTDDADELSAAHTKRFLDHAARLRPTPGALDLLDDLERREVPFRIATSAGADERRALLDALGRDDLPSADADEVEAPKPAPDLLLATCAQLHADPAHTTLVGDSPWDAEAADQVGMRTIAVRCGGFADQVLLGAGAVDVVDDPRALVGRL
jgi:HAD superfamily hydrolase (TIGR01509 family)